MAMWEPLRGAARDRGGGAGASDPPRGSIAWSLRPDDPRRCRSRLFAQKPSVPASPLISLAGALEPPALWCPPTGAFP